MECFECGDEMRKDIKEDGILYTCGNCGYTDFVEKWVLETKTGKKEVE